MLSHDLSQEHLGGLQCLNLLAQVLSEGEDVLARSLGSNWSVDQDYKEESFSLNLYVSTLIRLNWSNTCAHRSKFEVCMHMAMMVLFRLDSTAGFDS